MLGVEAVDSIVLGGTERARPAAGTEAVKADAAAAAEGSAEHLGVEALFRRPNEVSKMCCQN